MTHDELLARIDGERERLRIARDGLIEEGRYTAAAEVSRHLLSWNTLRAVVELKDRDVSHAINEIGQAFDEGYNKALADIRADIERELG